MNRGVLYITWEEDYTIRHNYKPGIVDRSITSLMATNPGLDYRHVALPNGSTLLDKAKMFDISPFDETLYLDADTVVLGDLSFGFEMAKRHGIACSICECPWAERYPSIVGDIIEYNTGVLFFDQSDKRTDVGALFYDWIENNKSIDSSIEFISQHGKASMPMNDQAGFAKAVYDAKFNPFILPMQWNFRPIWQNQFFGPIKIWHDYQEPYPRLLEINPTLGPMDFVRFNQ